ncbi:hypothetical protein RUND412_004663 [Rhizina undulata]
MHSLGYPFPYNVNGDYTDEGGNLNGARLPIPYTNAPMKMDYPHRRYHAEGVHSSGALVPITSYSNSPMEINNVHPVPNTRTTSVVREILEFSRQLGQARQTRSPTASVRHSKTTGKHSSVQRSADSIDSGASLSGGNSSYGGSLSKKRVELSFGQVKLSENIQSRFLFAKNPAYGPNATSVPVTDEQVTINADCEETTIPPPKVGSFFDNHNYKAPGRSTMRTSEQHPPMPKFGQGDARLVEGEISPTAVKEMNCRNLLSSTFGRGGLAKRLAIPNVNSRSLNTPLNTGVSDAGSSFGGSSYNNSSSKRQASSLCGNIDGSNDSKTDILGATTPFDESSPIELPAFFRPKDMDLPGKKRDIRTLFEPLEPEESMRLGTNPTPVLHCSKGTSKTVGRKTSQIDGHLGKFDSSPYFPNANPPPRPTISPVAAALNFRQPEMLPPPLIPFDQGSIMSKNPTIPVYHAVPHLHRSLNPMAPVFRPSGARLRPLFWKKQCCWTHGPLGRKAKDCRYGEKCAFGHEGDRYLDDPEVKMHYEHGKFAYMIRDRVEKQVSKDSLRESETRRDIPAMRNNEENFHYYAHTQRNPSFGGLHEHALFSSHRRSQIERPMERTRAPLTPMVDGEIVWFPYVRKPPTPLPPHPRPAYRTLPRNFKMEQAVPGYAPPYFATPPTFPSAALNIPPTPSFRNGHVSENYNREYGTGGHESSSRHSAALNIPLTPSIYNGHLSEINNRGYGAGGHESSSRHKNEKSGGRI